MPVQSVVFDKRIGRWTPAKAETFLEAHNFLGPPESHADETENTLRYRQHQPVPGARYFTKPLSYLGVSVVIDLPAKGGGARRAEPEEPEEAEGDDIYLVNRETSDQELEQVGHEKIPGFLGCVARSRFADLYPEDEPMAKGSSAIINLDYGDYARGGTHWTSARVAKDAPLLLYYDSFGQPPPREVSLTAKRHGLGVSYSDIPNQQLDEVNCGPRALAVLQELSDAAEKGQELACWADIGQVDHAAEVADLSDDEIMAD